MMKDHTKVLNYLLAVETLADEIMYEKNEVLALDIQRHKNRQALRDLKKLSERKCWLTIGSVLVKQNFESALALLEKDQIQINMDINKLQSELKVKVIKHRDLEMQPPLPGLLLAPMTNKECEGLRNARLFSK